MWNSKLEHYFWPPATGGTWYSPNWQSASLNKLEAARSTFASQMLQHASAVTPTENW